MCNCCGVNAWTYCFSENGFDLGRCGVCGLHYVRPMPCTEQRMTELESSHFAGDQTVSPATLHLAQERRLRAQRDALIATAARFAPHGRWLDVGCGTGTFMKQIQAKGIPAEGIELTKERREAALRETRSTVYDAPLETLKMPPNCYAAVTLINVFSHLTNPADTLREIQRVLMPGGALLLHTGEIGPGVKRRHAFSWDLGDHLYWLGLDTIERYAEIVGVRLVYRDRRWAPATIYTRDRFMLKGRSRLRNAIKAAIVYTPGALGLLRWYMLTWHEVDNPVHASTIVLTKSVD